VPEIVVVTLSAGCLTLVVVWLFGAVMFTRKKRKTDG
jgi:hypothetical protein